MSTVWQDLRYGMRTLLKSPGFTLVAVLSLGLGIGANTVVFSIVNALLVRPLPYERPEQLVAVHQTQLRQGIQRSPVSYPDFADWSQQSHYFEQVAAYDDQVFNMRGDGAPEPIEGAVISQDLFKLLGVSPAVGRAFTPEECRPGADRVAILSHGLWVRRFGSDPRVVGKTVNLNGDTYAVVGVMPAGFEFPAVAEVWTPLALDAAKESRGSRFLLVVARLKDGRTAAQAQTDLAAVARRIEEEHPETNKNWSAKVTPFGEDIVGKDIQAVLYLLLATVGFVLLIACANVANLLLARAVARQKEVSIRAALGAARGRLVRQFLTESVLVALLGGALGVLLANWGLRLLVAQIPVKLPFWMHFDIDGRVLVATLAVSALTGVVFGIVPALSASRAGLVAALKDGARGATEGPKRGRLQRALVVLEVALSLVLLIGATLMIKSFMRMQQSSPGFNPQNVLTIRLAPGGPQYANEQQRSDFYSEVVRRVGSMPGVQAVGAVNNLPLGGSDSNASIVVENRPSPNGGAYRAGYFVVTPGFFGAMGVPLVKGRAFEESDVRQSPRVAVVNESMVKRFWPDEDPVGKRFRIWSANKEPNWITVVGVAGDVKRVRISEEPEIQLYYPHTQVDWGGMTLVVRGAADPAAMTSAVRGSVGSIDKKVPLYNVFTMPEVVTKSVWLPRIYGLVFGVFGIVALVLATVGLYGVVSYSVGQRTHEIGIRRALGAVPFDVLKLVIGQGMKLTLVGIGVGLCAAVGVTRVLASLLHGVSATDPVIFGTMSLVFAAVALAASYVPARKALRVDPMIVLRCE
ncbi:MAG TPA: ABC transporter permease [Pyrinomonadaceae bacterium]